MCRSHPSESLSESVQPFNSWIFSRGGLVQTDPFQKQFLSPEFGGGNPIGIQPFYPRATIIERSDPAIHFLTENKLSLASTEERNHLEEILRRELTENAAFETQKLAQHSAFGQSVLTDNNHYFKVPTEECNGLSFREHPRTFTKQKVNEIQDVEAAAKSPISVNRVNRVLKRKHDSEILEYDNRTLSTSDNDSNKNEITSKRQNVKIFSTQRTTFQPYHRTGTYFESNFIVKHFAFPNSHSYLVIH